VPRYSLGLELSTQSAKYVVLGLDGKIALSGKFDFDATFPVYGTKGGVLPADQPEIRHASPGLLTESIDEIFSRLVKKGIPLAEIGAVKADAMQHCSVYASKKIDTSLASLHPGKSLLEQIENSFTRSSSPIWEDRSSATETEFLTNELGSRIPEITGNHAELRFPGPQIMKWAIEDTEAYANTAHIFLLSAYITSILSGKIAPVDTGDGWGTNLNSLAKKDPGFDSTMIAVAESYIRKHGGSSGLGEKIGEMKSYDEPVGALSPYFVEKYGFGKDTVVLVGTGDNPATLLGCGGRAVISLGSSYTINGVMENISPSKERNYNVFGYAGGAMALTCFTNGAKLHDEFLHKYLAKENPDESDWRKYETLFGQNSLAESENLMLAYLLDESVPLSKARIKRDGFDESDPAKNIRSLYISQALSLKLHSSHLKDATALCIVGGVSRNKAFRQVVTDIFGSPTYMIRDADYAAPLGCAISGARHIESLSYEEAAKKYVEKEASSGLLPSRENQKHVPRLLERYAKLEKAGK